MCYLFVKKGELVKYKNWTDLKNHDRFLMEIFTHFYQKLPKYRWEKLPGYLSYQNLHKLPYTLCHHYQRSFDIFTLKFFTKSKIVRQISPPKINALN